MAKIELKQELIELADMLTGEAQLREKEKKVAKLKKEAIENQKLELKKRVAAGEVKLEKEDDIQPDKKVVQKIKLFEWEAPIRQKFDLDLKVFFVVVGLALLFILLLAILGNYALMAAIIALLFFVYVAGTTDPINVTHIITARGIETLDKLYEWYALDQFWFTEKSDHNILIVSTRLRFPNKIIMLLDAKDRSTVFLLLQDKLLYREIKNWNWLDKKTYGEYVPLEKV